MNHPTCKSCRHSGVMLNATQQIVPVCRRRPPKVFAVFVQTQNGPQWLSTTAWPPISQDDWCGEHEVGILNS